MQHQAWRRSAGAKGGIVGLMRAKPSWRRGGGMGKGGQSGGPEVGQDQRCSRAHRSAAAGGEAGKYVITV